MAGTIGLVAFFCGYYLLAGIGVNLGYHRLLAHRSLRLPQILERICVTLGLPAGTPVQWVGTHRTHHRFADTPADPHSPHYGGFLYSHVGWYLQTRKRLPCLLYAFAGPLRMIFDTWHRPRTNQTFNNYARDVSDDEYFRFLSSPMGYAIGMLPHIVLPIAVVSSVWGPHGVIAYSLLLVVMYNFGESIDSIAHLFGNKLVADNESRNFRFLGLVTLGEGWHSCHHAYPASAKHGLLPGQFDFIWHVIRFLKWIGLADAVIVPPREVIVQLTTAQMEG